MVRTTSNTPQQFEDMQWNKTYVHKKMCSRIFVESLFILAQTVRAQVFINKTTEKVWSVHTTDYYSARKRKLVMIVTLC